MHGVPTTVDGVMHFGDVGAAAPAVQTVPVSQFRLSSDRPQSAPAGMGARFVAAHEPVGCAQVQLHPRRAIPPVVGSFKEVIKKVHMTFWDRHPVG